MPTPNEKLALALTPVVEALKDGVSIAELTKGEYTQLIMLGKDKAGGWNYVGYAEGGIYGLAQEFMNYLVQFEAETSNIPKGTLLEVHIHGTWKEVTKQ